MSARTLCPYPDLACDLCVEAFLDEHPGAEVWQHVYHYCECPMVATTDGGDVCVGCGDHRDLAAEFRHLAKGWAA